LRRAWSHGAILSSARQKTGRTIARPNSSCPQAER
jgi:hypothetical protein